MQKHQITAARIKAEGTLRRQQEALEATKGQIEYLREMESRAELEGRPNEPRLPLESEKKEKK